MAKPQKWRDADKQLIEMFFPSFEQIRSYLYALRVEKGATATHSTADINISPDEPYGQTTDGKRFLLFDTGADDVDRIIGFCSDVCLELLSKANQWHVDGSCPTRQSR